MRVMEIHPLLLPRLLPLPLPLLHKKERDANISTNLSVLTGAGRAILTGLYVPMLLNCLSIHLYSSSSPAQKKRRKKHSRHSSELKDSMSDDDLPRKKVSTSHYSVSYSLMSLSLCFSQRRSIDITTRERNIDEHLAVMIGALF